MYVSVKSESNRYEECREIIKGSRADAGRNERACWAPGECTKEVKSEVTKT